MNVQNIMAYKNISDIDKLILVFNRDKDSIKENNPDLYYAILAIKDDLKIGYKFTDN